MGLNGDMQQTFLESFSKIYSYPYGNSFLPRDTQSNPLPEIDENQPFALEPVALENTIAGQSTFERAM